MARQPALARRTERLLDTAVISTAPVAGGDICTSYRLRLGDGRVAFTKTHPHPPPGFFAAEARSLDRLRTVSDGAPVPEVWAFDDSCLVIEWIEPGKPGQEAASDFGRALARTHLGAGVSEYGAAEDGYIGRLPMPNASAPTWAEFYATRRVLPYLKLAADRGNVSESHVAAIEGLIGKLPALLPEESPSLVHGDLWGGNVVWGLDGRTWLVDPACYAGHREVDLAMLSLFGLHQLQRVLDAYAEAAPLTDGWEDRLPIHQLFPLLAHAAMFGGSYGVRAAEIASRY